MFAISLSCVFNFFTPFSSGAEPRSFQHLPPFLFFVFCGWPLIGRNRLEPACITINAPGPRLGGGYVSQPDPSRIFLDAHSNDQRRPIPRSFLGSLLQAGEVSNLVAPPDFTTDPSWSQRTKLYLDMSSRMGTLPTKWACLEDCW